MIRQIKYFQSVIRNNSFSEAAEECHISQSAISQQIQALERELGFQLLERKNRKFALTPAGEHFYKKSLVLIADFERICREAAKIANDDEAVLRLAYLRSYSGDEFRRALDIFAEKYPDVSIQIEHGNHEEIYELLVSGKIDIAFNDQRRKFADGYVNLILAAAHSSIEISSRSPLAALPQISPQELKNTPCILVSSEKQQDTEKEYYQNIVGFQGEFIFVENLEAARLLVIGGGVLCLWRAAGKR
ncbi:MAG: LysR family transcriptional regulator [Clostridium sp.]|nr:LysR family transcriptional regulator [Clostridium sp.]